MEQIIRQVMTANPIMCPATASLVDVARMMRDQGIGDVLVAREGSLYGLVTDRDIVVRGLADGNDPKATAVGDICSHDLMTLAPTDSVDDAIQLMRDRALRRVPVVDKGKPVGIVSLGDLAREQDADGALAAISGAPANT